MIPLLMLVACSVPPQAQQEPVIMPVIVVEDKKDATHAAPKTDRTRPKQEAKQPEKKPEDKPGDRKADKVCPPIEGESDNQRILRKLDCLIERD